MLFAAIQYDLGFRVTYISSKREIIQGKRVIAFENRVDSRLM
jgi:hypothetical protein